MFKKSVISMDLMLERIACSFAWRVKTLGRCARFISCFILCYILFFVPIFMFLVALSFTLVWVGSVGSIIGANYGGACLWANIFAFALSLYFALESKSELSVPPTLDMLRKDFINGRITKSMFCRYYPIVKKGMRDWKISLEKAKAKRAENRKKAEEIRKESEMLEIKQKKELEELKKVRKQELIEIVKETREQSCKTKEEE